MFLNKKYRNSFTLLDSLIGSLIISSSIIFYFNITQQLNHNLLQSRHQLVESRIKYEKSMFNK